MNKGTTPPKGRPATYPGGRMVKVTITLPESLRAYAAKHRLNISQLTRAALEAEQAQQAK